MFGGSAADAPAVAVTPPPPDAPANVVLAATSTPSAAPATPRPAPAGDPYRDALADAYRSFKRLAEGKNADYIPILASVDPALYGLVIVTVAGRGLRDRRRARRVLDPVGEQAVHRRARHRDRGRRRRRQAHRRQRHRAEVQLDPRDRSAEEPPADKDHVTPRATRWSTRARSPTVDLVAVAPGMDKWAVHAGQPRGVRRPQADRQRRGLPLREPRPTRTTARSSSCSRTTRSSRAIRCRRWICTRASAR